MIRIRYSSPDEVELAGCKGDFEALLEHLQSFLNSHAEVAETAADPSFNPAPYDSRLRAIEFIRRSGPVTVSVEGEVLRVSGSSDNLKLFESWLEFDGCSAPYHCHYDYYEGNPWIAPASLPLVISLEPDSAV